MTRCWAAGEGVEKGVILMEAVLIELGEGLRSRAQTRYRFQKTVVLFAWSGYVGCQ